VIRAVKVVKGEMTGDSKNEAAILLACTTPPTNFYTTELQVFTDGPRPLGRIFPPHGVNSVSNAWDPSAIFVPGHHLITGVLENLSGDARCCPSGRDTYMWTWTAHGFTAAFWPPAYN
jgi:hypothetical protein